MREVYACRLELSDPDALTTARALVRYWIGQEYGGWSDDARSPWRPARSVVVTWRSLRDDQTSETLNEYVWRRPHEVDRSLVRRTVVEAARESTGPWVLVRETIESLDPTLVGGAPAHTHRPTLVPMLVDRLPCVDGGWRLRQTPRTLSAGDAMEADAFVRGGRRLPLVVISPRPGGAPTVAPGDVASRLAGLAHVAVLADGEAVDALADELGARHAPRDGAIQLLWPRWRSSDPPHRHRRWHPEEASRVVAELERTVLDVAALRIPEPSLLPRLVAATNRQRADALVHPASEPAPAGPDAAEARPGEPVRDDAAFADAALDELQRALEEIDVLRDQVASLEADRAALRDAYVQVAAAEGRARSLYDVVSEAQRTHRHLLVLPSALDSAARARARDPERLATQLAVLEELAAARAEGRLTGRFTDACRARGLDWASDVSDSASAKHAGAYTVRANGTTYHLGPHLRINDPDGPLRVYCDFRASSDRIVVGHVGAHLPDRTTG